MPGLRPTPSIRASAPQPRRCDSDSNIDATAMQPQRRCNHDGNATATTAMVGATSEQRRDHDARNVTAMAARRQRNGDAVATRRQCDRNGVTATRWQCDRSSNNGRSDGSTMRDDDAMAMPLRARTTRAPTSRERWCRAPAPSIGPLCIRTMTARWQCDGDATATALMVGAVAMP